jgi:hypothetical protein
MQSQSLSKQLKKRGFTKFSVGANVVHWSGIGLRDPFSQPLINEDADDAGETV